MTQTYTETEVSCAVCHAELTDEEIRFLWSDVDFLYHGDHWACVSEEQEPAYWAKAKALS